MTDMPQAFADALCNDHQRLLGKHYFIAEAAEHGHRRYRGVEGKNGVACDECRAMAAILWADYRRILESLS